MAHPTADPSFETIAKGVLHGGGQEGIEKGTQIINDEQNWQRLLERIDVVNEESREFTETEIDFDRFVVVALFDQVRTSSGYDVAFTKLQTENDRLVLSIQTSEPEGVSLNVITQPFHIIKIEKTEREIAFRWDER